MSVQEGDAAPDFEMPASGGRTVSLSALKGKPFILYFYPKADTPGCTKEACAFQEALPQLGKIGLDVIGVSPDKIKPIEDLPKSMRLSFPWHPMKRRPWRGGMAPGSKNRCTAGNIWGWNGAHSWLGQMVK